MSTKATLSTSITTNLASASNITATELRAVENLLLDNAYGSVITDTQATTNVFTAEDVVEKLYNLKIVKQGRHVTLNGTLTKNSVGIIELEYWCTITNAEYLPNNDHEFWGTLSNGTPVRLYLYATGQIFIFSPLGASEVINISTVYNTLS